MEWLKLFEQKLSGARTSLVIWFNTSLLTMISLYDAVKDLIPEFQSHLPEGLYKKVVLVALLINILLRFRTSKSLQEKAP